MPVRLEEGREEEGVEVDEVGGAKATRGRVVDEDATGGCWEERGVGAEGKEEGVGEGVVDIDLDRS